MGTAPCEKIISSPLKRKGKKLGCVQGREGGREEGRDGWWGGMKGGREGQREGERANQAPFCTQEFACLLAFAVESDVGRQQEWEGARGGEGEGRVFFPSLFQHSHIGGAVCLASYPRSFSHPFFFHFPPPSSHYAQTQRWRCRCRCRIHFASSVVAALASPSSLVNLPSLLVFLLFCAFQPVSPKPSTHLFLFSHSAHRRKEGKGVLEGRN